MRELPASFLTEMLKEALQGNGRERELGGGNVSIELTLLKSDLQTYPKLSHLAGKHLTLVLNEHGMLIGHKVRK